jgi:hypothetical protein
MLFVDGVGGRHVCFYRFLRWRHHLACGRPSTQELVEGAIAILHSVVQAVCNNDTERCKTNALSHMKLESDISRSADLPIRWP